MKYYNKIHKNHHKITKSDTKCAFSVKSTESVYVFEIHLCVCSDRKCEIFCGRLLSIYDYWAFCVVDSHLLSHNSNDLTRKMITMPVF